MTAHKCKALSVWFNYVCIHGPTVHVCQHLSVRESIKEISSLPFLCSCLHVCVSLHSSSLMSIGGISMTLWILELNLPLSQHRPSPQDAMPRCGLWGCGQGDPGGQHVLIRA